MTQGWVNFLNNFFSFNHFSQANDTLTGYIRVKDTDYG